MLSSRTQGRYSTIWPHPDAQLGWQLIHVQSTLIMDSCHVRTTFTVARCGVSWPSCAPTNNLLGQFFSAWKAICDDYIQLLPSQPLSLKNVIDRVKWGPNLEPNTNAEISQCFTLHDTKGPPRCANAKLLWLIVPERCVMWQVDIPRQKLEAKDIYFAIVDSRNIYKVLEHLGTPERMVSVSFSQRKYMAIHWSGYAYTSRQTCIPQIS
jgi:hypothetical protein